LEEFGRNLDVTRVFVDEVMGKIWVTVAETGLFKAVTTALSTFTTQDRDNMRSSRCVFNTAAALHRVFIAPIDVSNLSPLRHGRLQFLPRLQSRAPKLILSQQRRHYAGESPKRRLPRDDEIKSWSVSLVNEDGKLEDPRSTYDLLSSIDRKTQSLVVVAAGEPGVPPICKIMDKKAMRDAEKAKAKSARNSAVTVKTIELNWAIDGNDLNHRLQRIREFLGKGHRVEVLMAAKRKGRKATEEEAQALVGRVRGVIGECDGARETKPMEGKLLGTATVYAEGKAVAKP
jgi:translation initiation factor IF-3